jgi:Zn finger protein HypA/HybF involved in hydrogenase expression
MNEKQVTGECSSCESSFDVSYVQQFVSQELPQYCPFCGTEIQDIQEHYIDEDSDLDDEWNEI